MESGIEFLRSQVNNAVMQHGAFLQSLLDHESQAEDERYRNLCARHIPRMREHQRMLEEFQRSIGAESSGRAEGNVLENVAGAMKRAAGTALGMAKDLADAPRQSDFLRLVGDIVMSRQSEDTFKTFREAGRQLGLDQLAQMGEMGERHHDDYADEANRLAQQIFVERARGAEHALSTMRTQQPGFGSPLR